MYMSGWAAFNTFTSQCPHFEGEINKPFYFERSSYNLTQEFCRKVLLKNFFVKNFVKFNAFFKKQNNKIRKVFSF